LLNKYCKLKRVKEYNIIKAVLEQAELYSENLVKILNMDFDKPDDDIKEFAIKNSLDLSDPEIKQELHTYKLDYLKRINKFYEETINISSKDEDQKTNVQVHEENKLKKHKSEKKIKKIVNDNKKVTEDLNKDDGNDDNLSTIKLKKNISPKNLNKGNDYTGTGNINSNNINKVNNLNHSELKSNSAKKIDKNSLFFQLFYIVASLVMLLASLLFIFCYFDLRSN